MNKITIFILFFTLNLIAQTTTAKYWLDPEGKEIKIKYLSFCLINFLIMLWLSEKPQIVE